MGIDPMRIKVVFLNTHASYHTARFSHSPKRPNMRTWERRWVGSTCDSAESWAKLPPVAEGWVDWLAITERIFIAEGFWQG